MSEIYDVPANMSRFITFVVLDQGCDPQCLSESEFDDDACFSVNDVDEFVWQFAENKEQAIAQHDVKFDAWEANPNKDTY